MQNYIGTKELKAMPLNLGDYNKKRGWTIPEDENPEREGYFVEYPDGYVSWSPKEIFEESYILKNTDLIRTTSELPHQVRVYDEAAELLDKSTKLQAFIESNPIFSNLPADEQTRLKLQLTTMECYYSILVERTRNF